MAELATYVGIQERTAVVGSVAVARGVRVNNNANSVIAVADATTRGEFVTLTAGAIGQAISVASLQAGNKVPMVSSVAVAVGDLAYSAANGQATNVSTNAVLIGTWALATSGSGVLGEVELMNPA